MNCLHVNFFFFNFFFKKCTLWSHVFIINTAENCSPPCNSSAKRVRFVGNCFWLLGGIKQATLKQAASHAAQFNPRG